MKYIEISIIRLAIWFLKRAVGEPCKTEDTFFEDSLDLRGCLTCRTYRVINFLEDWIELLKI